MDVDQAVLGRYLLREIDRQIRLKLRMELTKIEQAEYQQAKTEARENDNRYSAAMAARASGPHSWRLRDYPPNGDGTLEL